MKQIDFISSENVVNIANPEKTNIAGELSCDSNLSILLAAIDKRNHDNSKKNKAVNHYGFFSKNFEAFVSCASNAYFRKFNYFSD